jgi:hypothetical protein
MDNFDRRAAARAESFPTEDSALAAFHDAYARLIELGWRPPVYFDRHCDRTAPIASIGVGSAMIHYAEGAIWPNAVLWKEKDVPRRDRAFTDRSVEIARASSI